MVSSSQKVEKPWFKTPVVRSAALSRAAGCEIILKLENLQPSGSFKSRGIGNLMLKALARHQASPAASTPIHFYSSSGGNAGMACATAAQSLKQRATIVVPFSTSAFMMRKLEVLGADVVQHGKDWAEADTYLREVAIKQTQGEEGIYVPPFDHEDVWEGASGIVGELYEDLEEGFDAVICSVGGGGLLSGIMMGLARNRNDVKLIAVETAGADSLAASVKAGKLVTLPGITSIANCLGATRVTRKAFEYSKDPRVTSVVLSDAEAAMGSVRFADDEKMLVEIACGVSVAMAYNGKLRGILGEGLSDEQWARKRIVIVVCGGNYVSLDILDGYRKSFGG